MNILDTVLVILILLGAAFFLYKTFKPKKGGGGCGCGTVDCKVPKPKITASQSNKDSTA